MRKRGSGVLLHPTSLPGPYGIGGLGASACRFVDFLEAGLQSLWQVLPLGPTGYGDSPYQSFSSFAGNPLLIDPELLVQEGFLAAEDLEPPGFPRERVDYGAVIPYKSGLLKKAYRHFLASALPAAKAAFERFCQENGSWLRDFALFMAIKGHPDHGGGSWDTWARELRRREPTVLARWAEALAEETGRVCFEQFLFFRQWRALKRYANARGIRILGDIPIFVAYDSADVWANQEQFHLDGEGRPTVIAGVPPDYFSATGQRWGNPLYDWRALKREGFHWWLERIGQNLKLVDVIRLDHFRGFEAYWEIPAAEQTAVKGRWVKGPGAAFFQALAQAFGEIPIVAEDLGVITPAVERLRKRCGFPGMKVLQFAFDGDPDHPFLPHNYSPECVVYTGTHDNDTTLGWYLSASEEVKDQVRRYLARDGHDICWDLIRLAQASVADTVIVPLQDLMKLGSAARMNYPSRAEGNWQWRCTAEMLGEEIALRLAELTTLYSRRPAEKKRTALPPRRPREEEPL